MGLPLALAHLDANSYGSFTGCHKWFTKVLRITNTEMGIFLFVGVMGVPRLSVFDFFLFCPCLFSMLEKIIYLFAKT